MKSIIYIVFSAQPGTSTTEVSLPEKLQILRKAYDACRFEGMEVVLIAAGDSAGVEEVRKVIPGVPLHGVWGQFDRQRGECALGLRILQEAEQAKADWIVKIAGDTFHPVPGWAQKMVDLGVAHGAELVATGHHRPDWVTTQAYAVTPAFMRATFPTMAADYGRIGIEAQWGERIAAAGLLGKWHKPSAMSLTADGCENYVPESPELMYLHAHRLASTESWKPIDNRVKPDLKLRISIVVPARNEVQTNPFRNNVMLLSDTFASVAETSPADNLPECILVDDASDKPLPPCPYPGTLKVLRNFEPLGVDPSRNRGIEAASGEIVGVLDGHMRVQTQEGVACEHGIQRLATLARDRNAMVVARCAHMELPTQKGPPLCGGVFIPLTDPKQPLALGWGEFYPPDGVRQINGLLGASYFAPAALWKKLQGFVACCKNWGFSEEGLALKCAFLNIPIFYCGDVTISHWFRPNGPHPYHVSDSEKWLNRARVLKVVFDGATFESFWLPRCKASIWEARYDAALLEPALLEEAARFQAVKVKSDAEVLREIFRVGI